MAAPTITSFSPATVWTGGQVVRITGTNFRLAAIPGYAYAGPYPTPTPSVSVTVNGAAATAVRVLSATALECHLPPGAPGLATVVLTNLDDNGAPIVGESVTNGTGLTYARPGLAEDSDLTRVDRAIIRALKVAVTENVVKTVSTDFGEDGLEITALGPMPSLSLSGPSLIPSPLYAERANFDVDTETGFELRRRPMAMDLEYTLTGFAETEAQNMALLAATRTALDRMTELTIDRDPADPTKGTVSFALEVPDISLFRETSAPNNSNVRSFAGGFVIRGVRLEQFASFPREALVETGGEATTVTVITTRF